MTSFPLMTFAVNDCNSVDSVNVCKNGEDSAGNILINGNGHNIGIFVFGCTYLHSIDVYACLAENTCHLADHARFIFMRSKDDAAFRFKVYTEVVKRNDFRFFPVEKGACNTMCTFIGINSERDRIGEVMSFFALTSRISICRSSAIFLAFTKLTVC